MTSTRAQACYIFFAGLLFFILGLGSEIISFESRFYVFALEMWRHGPSWFPTTYQTPYPDYPATSTFLIYIFSKLFGGVSRLTAVLPSAIAASITLSVTYLIGSLFSRIWGIAAVLFLLFTLAFISEARSISLDMYTTAITAGCFYLVSSATLLQKPSRIFWIFLLFILGFIFRGPLGLIIPTGVVCVYYLLEKDFKKLFLTGIASIVLLAICSYLLVTLAQHVGGDAFMQEVLQKEVLGRLQDDAKTPPFYFYFLESFGAYAITYPLAVVMLIGLLPNFNYSKSTRFLQKILAWALIILIGLSIPGDKKVRYILPAAPAFALLCGYLFIVTQERGYLFFLKKIFVKLCIVLPFISVAGILWLHHQKPDLSFHYHFVLITSIVLAILALLVYRRELFSFGIAVLTFFVINVGIIEPINLNLNKSRDFVLQVEALRQNKPLVFYREGRDGLVIKYLANMHEETLPLFIKKDSDLKKLKGVIIVVTEEHYQQLSKKTLKKTPVILKGKLGRENIIILKK